MADELALKFQLTYTPTDTNQVKVAPPLINSTVTMTGTNHLSGTQEIGFAVEEALVFNEIGTLGYVLIRNLGPTNYVDIGPTGKLAVRLKVGEVALFRAAAALYGQANTAAVDIQYWAFED